MNPAEFIAVLNRQSLGDAGALFSGTPIGAKITASLAAGGSGDVSTTQDYILQSLQNDGWTVLIPVSGQFDGNNFVFTVTTAAGAIASALDADTVKAQFIQTFQKLGFTVNGVTVQVGELSGTSNNNNLNDSVSGFLSQIGTFFGFDKPNSTLGGLGLTAVAGGAIVLVAVLILAKKD